MSWWWPKNTNPRGHNGMRPANGIACGTALPLPEESPAPRHLGGRTMQVLLSQEFDLPGGQVLEIRVLKSLGDETGVFRR